MSVKICKEPKHNNLITNVVNQFIKPEYRIKEYQEPNLELVVDNESEGKNKIIEKE